MSNCSPNGKHLVATDKTLLIDEKTGEVLSECVVEKVKRVTTDNVYCKLYTSDMKRWQKLSTKQLLLFLAMCSEMEYSGLVHASGLHKKRLQEMSGVTNEQVYQVSMRKLKDNGFIAPYVDETLKQFQGYYLVNPNIVAKGSVYKVTNETKPLYLANLKRIAERQRRQSCKDFGAAVADFQKRCNNKSESKDNVQKIIEKIKQLEHNSCE